ncbi:MAG: alkaline phosphatase family protein [Desulfurococcales archaeon]|nr:alkaline phosphatase family protein [Desulfurococcales archaeon]
MKRRALVLAVDGLSWSVYRRLRGHGYFRYISNLESRGVAGSIETIPPLTPPMWTSITSGVNPGKHGVFSFYIYNRRSWEPLRLYNSLDVRAPRLHDIVSYNGGSSTVVNLPLSSWPPTIFRGAMVSDWLSPHDYARPSQLDERLKRELRAFNIGEWREEPCKLVARDAAIAASILDSLEELFDSSNLVFYLVQLVDALMHRYPRELLNPREPCIKDALSLVDEVFSSLISVAADEALILVVSDHGNEPVKYRVTLPKALEEAGLVVPKFSRLVEPGEVGSRREAGLLFRAAGLALRVPLLGKLATRVGRWLVRVLGISVAGVERPIPDPARSVAVFPQPWYFEIYLNETLIGSVEGALERVIEAIHDAMRRSGHRFLHRIDRGRGGLYQGPYSSEAPHLVVSPAPGYDLSSLNLYAPLIEKVNETRGNHTPFNMHIVHVPPNSPNLREAAKLIREPWDYAILVLASLGIPIPDNTDSTLCNRAGLECKKADYNARFLLSQRLAARLAKQGRPGQN